MNTDERMNGSGNDTWHTVLSTAPDSFGARLVLRLRGNGEFVTHYFKGGHHFAGQYMGWGAEGLKSALASFEQRIKKELRYG